ncbi:MAG: hypothetical protein PHS57_01105 [Alphaproteobacteria bacterium]|nr:hypothetical protein [Alphaproteobacteria bacterium]
MSGTEQALLDRHGEIGLMSFLEQWERKRGIKHMAPVSFEDRWEHFINATNDNLAKLTASAVACH